MATETVRLEPVKKKVIFGSLPVLGSVQFLLQELDPTKRKTGPEATDTDPKATPTRRRPEPHPENTAQKEWGSNRETLTVKGSGRPRLQIQCRSRPGEPLSEHATYTTPTARHGESWNVMPAV